MIIGAGIDMVDIARIEKLVKAPGKKFIMRTFTANEQKTCDARQERAASYAKRFAAKEACSKALGTGIGRDAFLTEIEISNDERGAPHITLRGAALKRLKALTPKGKKAKIFLSLSDEKKYALAQVIIEAL